MTLLSVVDKMVALYKAASSVYLNTALCYKYDLPTTQRTDSLVEVVVIPGAIEDNPVAIDGDGWFDNFTVTILARYPGQWEDDDKHLKVVEELCQVIRDNLSWLDAGGDQATLKSRTVHLGYDARGNQRLNQVWVTAVWNGPGLAASS